MVLTIDEVRKIAALARLHLSAEEEERFVPQLRRIVEYIDQLDVFEAAEPQSAGRRSRQGDDFPEECLPVEVVLRNAPETYGDLLVVPQVKAGDDA
jgi:aspartyl-tRNA(Asn)/glutamyl-tRNA(Gln) amidotransferase subunit C